MSDFIGFVGLHILAIIFGGLFGYAMGGDEIARMWIYGIGMGGFECTALIFMVRLRRIECVQAKSASL